MLKILKTISNQASFAAVVKEAEEYYRQLLVGAKKEEGYIPSLRRFGAFFIVPHRSELER